MLLAEEYGIDADDELDDWIAAAEPVAEPVAAVPASVAIRPAAGDGVELTSVAELRESMRPGTRVTIIEAGSRTDRRQSFTSRQHPEQGLERTVLYPSGANWALDHGAPFESGAAREWTFEDGLAVHETSLRRTVYRITPAQAIGDESLMATAIARSRAETAQEKQEAVVAAAAEHQQVLDDVLALATTSNPMELLAELPSAWRKRSESGWAVDDAAAAVGAAGGRPTVAQRDRERPELLRSEMAVNEAWSEELREGLAFGEQRLRTGPPIAGLDDHVEELRAAVRGLQGEMRLLRARAVNVGDAAA